MNGVYDKITTLLEGYTTVTGLVGQNSEYSTAADKYSIRPGQLNEDDPFPGIVLAIPTVTLDQDLEGLSRHLKVTLQVHCVSLILSEAWALRNAVAFDTGTPDSSEGLHGESDTTGLLKSQHTSDSEDAFDYGDDSDRSLFVVTSTYQLEVSEGDL